MYHRQAAFEWPIDVEFLLVRSASYDFCVKASPRFKGNSDFLDGAISRWLDDKTNIEIFFDTLTLFLLGLEIAKIENKINNRTIAINI